MYIQCGGGGRRGTAFSAIADTSAIVRCEEQSISSPPAALFAHFLAGEKMGIVQDLSFLFIKISDFDLPVRGGLFP